MSFFNYLPAEYFLLFSRLSDDQVNFFDLDPYTLQKANLKQLSVDIIHQAQSKINQYDRSNSSHQSFFELYYSALAMASSFADLETATKNPKNVIEYIFNRTANILGNNVLGTYDIEDHEVPSDPLFDEIHKIFTFYRNVEGNPVVVFETLEPLQNKYPTFFMLHLQPIVLLFRAVSVAVSSYTDLGIPYFSPWLEFVKQGNYEYFQIILNHCVGLQYSARGRYTLALEHLNEVKRLSLKHQNNMHFPTMNNIADIFVQLNQLTEAEKIFRELHQKRPDAPVILLNLAETLYEQGRYEEALEYAVKTHQVAPEQPFVFYYFYEHQIRLAQGDFTRAEEIENLGKLIYEKAGFFGNKMVLNAMIASRNHTQGNLALAKDLFTENTRIAMENGFLRGLYRNYANLIEVQIDLVAIKQDDPVVRNQLYSMVNSLISLSDEQGMALASIEGQILRGRIYRHDNNLIEASSDFLNAAKLADEFGYEELYKKADSEFKDVEILIKKNQPYKEDRKSFFEGLKASLRRLIRVKSERPFNKKSYEFHGIVIINDMGMNLFSHYASDRLQSDASLVSGLVSAISSFIAELVEGKGFLKSVDHDDLSLVIEPTGRFITVCIVSDETFELREMTRNFTEQVIHILEPETSNLLNGIIPDELPKKLEELTQQVYLPPV